MAEALDAPRQGDVLDDLGLRTAAYPPTASYAARIRIYWPLAKAARRRGSLTHPGRNHATSTDPATGWTAFSQNPCISRTGQRLSMSPPLRGQEVDGRPDAVRRLAAIGVDEEEPLAPGRPGPRVHRVRLAEPAWRQLRHLDQAHPRVAGRHLAHDLGRPVAAPVVDHEISMSG